jgi:hypothetical protein
MFFSCFLLVSFLSYSWSLKIEAICFSETSNFSVLRSFIIQKIAHVIVTAVRTVNTTQVLSIFSILATSLNNQLKKVDFYEFYSKLQVRFILRQTIT